MTKPTISDVWDNVYLTGKNRVTARKEAARMYRQGASIREIAEATGRAYGGVYQILVESGVTFRPRGVPAGTKRIETR